MDFNKEQLSNLKKALVGLDKGVLKVEQANKDLQELKNRLKTCLGSSTGDIAKLKEEAEKVFAAEYLKLDIE